MFKSLKVGRFLVLAAMLGVFVIGGAVSARAETLVYRGSSTLLEAWVVDAANAFKAKTGNEVNVSGHSTGKGILSLMGGECNVAGGGRPLKSEEAAGGVTEIPIAMNSIAVFVHSSNPVGNLTMDQLKKIIAGEITNWSEVGGADQPILLILEHDKSSHKKVVQQVVMGDTPFATKGIPVNKSPEIFDKVSSFEPAIGYGSYALAKKHPGVKVVSIDGVSPDPANVASGAYKVAMKMYFYTKGQPSGVAAQFIEFLKSEEGKQIIENSGMSAL